MTITTVVMVDELHLETTDHHPPGDTTLTRMTAEDRHHLRCEAMEIRTPEMETLMDDRGARFEAMVTVAVTVVTMTDGISMCAPAFLSNGTDPG